MICQAATALNQGLQNPSFSNKKPHWRLPTTKYFLDTYAIVAEQRRLLC